MSLAHIQNPAKIRPMTDSRLAKELEYFKENQPELVQKYKGAPCH